MNESPNEMKSKSNTHESDSKAVIGMLVNKDKEILSFKNNLEFIKNHLVSMSMVYDDRNSINVDKLLLINQQIIK